MVWGCFSSAGLGNLNLVTGTMDADYYEDILQGNLFESAHDLFKKKPFLFQQDLDPKHTSRQIARFFQRNKVDVLPWCPNSPDLNPIEHVWDELNRRVRQNHRISSTQGLWEALQVEWLSFPISVAKTLVDAMPRRCQAVLDSNGWNTKY